MAVLCYTGPDGNLVYYETVPSICLADFGVLECDDDQAYPDGDYSPIVGEYSPIIQADDDLVYIDNDRNNNGEVEGNWIVIEAAKVLAEIASLNKKLAEATRAR